MWNEMQIMHVLILENTIKRVTSIKEDYIFILHSQHKSYAHLFGNLTPLNTFPFQPGRDYILDVA